jgi:hypothetical protein
MTTTNTPDNDSDLAQAIITTFTEIEAARALVYAQELGPLTILAALGSIEIGVRHIRNEADVVEQVNQQHLDISNRMQSQRNHAVRQRELMKIQLDEMRHDMQEDMIELRAALESRMVDAFKHGWQEGSLAVWHRFIVALQEAGYGELAARFQSLLD